MASYNKHSKRLNVDVEIDEVVSTHILLSDFIGEIDDEDILEEASRRGLIKNGSPDITKDALCDFFGKSRYTSIDDLLSLVRDKLEQELV